MRPYSSFPEKVLIIGSGTGGLSTAIILAQPESGDDGEASPTGLQQ